jgi:predicted TIM-barrel fold metal-dependent hydrolase
MHIKFAAVKSAALMEVAGKAEDVAYLERLKALATGGGLCAPAAEDVADAGTRGATAAYSATGTITATASSHNSRGRSSPSGNNRSGGGSRSNARGGGGSRGGGGGSRGEVRVTRVLVAQDQRYGEHGQRIPDRSKIYAPNSYVMSLAREHPGLFVPAVSIHPYRADAVEELVRLARQGVRLLHWHPAMMGIDPQSPLCLPLYRKMVVWGVALLCHVGASGARDRDGLGNPLRLRGPLRAGVTVVAMQGASKGHYRDADHPTQPELPAWELLLRMLRDQDNNGKLYVDISSLTSHRRTAALAAILDNPALHARLVYASGYPRPAVKHLARPAELASAGLVSREEATQLEEIRLYNPLLYDLVSKLTVRGPSSRAVLPPSVFTGSPFDLAAIVEDAGGGGGGGGTGGGSVGVGVGLGGGGVSASGGASSSGRGRALFNPEATLVCADHNSILELSNAARRQLRLGGDGGGGGLGSRRSGRRGGSSSRRSAFGSLPSSRETSESGGPREGIGGKRRVPPPISVPSTPSRHTSIPFDDDVAMSGTPTRTHASQRWTPAASTKKRGGGGGGGGVDLRRRAAAQGARARQNGSSSDSDF